MTDAITSPTPPRLFVAAWLIGAWRAQRWMWSESGCKAARRPLPSTRYARALGEGRRFELQRGSWMGVLVPMVVFSQFVDVLLAQGVIHLAAHGVRALQLHLLLLFASVWTVVWAVSLRSALRHVNHVLGPHTLTLAIGFKHLCRIPLAAIGDVRVIDRKADDWHAACGLERREVAALTAFDKPTLLIELKAGSSGAWWTRNGVQKPVRRWVAVYVDQAEALRAAVLAARPPAP